MTATPVIGVVAGGLVGAAATRHLARSGCRVVVFDTNPSPARSRVKRYGAVVVTDPTRVLAADVLAVCGPAPHHPLVASAVASGTPVVSVSDDLADVRHLLMLGDHGCRAALVIGAAMAPGLSGLLARYLIDRLHRVDELHIAVHGTGGPTCARQHHRSLGEPAHGWHDGEWIERAGGSGRELCWFPEPIGPHDCYRAALADPLLMHRAFPEVSRISARVSGTRRDRLTARLPMLTPPHAGGNEGSVRVEVRGADATGARVTNVMGASGSAAELAGAVCAATVLAVLDGAFAVGAQVLGEDSARDAALLDRVSGLGVSLQEYTGDLRAAAWPEPTEHR